MIIQRAPRTDPGYLLIRNDTVRDARLSFRARGVLAAILSRPDGWTTSAEQLAEEGAEGRDAIRSALKELENVGYMRRVKTQTSRGTWITQVHVSEVPQDQEQDPAGKPTCGFPAVGSPAVGFPGPKETEDREEDREVQTLVADAPPETPGTTTPRPKTHTPPTGPDFEAFWQAYPRRIGKGQARRAWTTAVKKTPPDTITAAARTYANAEDTQTRDPKYIPHPATWLNGERWNDEPEPTRTTYKPTAQELRDWPTYFASMGIA